MALKIFGQNTDKAWGDWATEMLMAGFETENLAILAGESEPFNSFKMKALIDKVLSELTLDYSNKEKVIKNYTCYLIDEFLARNLNALKMLRILKNVHVGMDYESFLSDFYLLYFAKSNLQNSDVQWYWKDITRENIDQVVMNYIKEWKAEHQCDE